MKSKKKNHKRKYKPYEPVKLKLFEIPDPFGGAPIEVRRAALSEAGAKARATFDAEYPKVVNWFDTYDPLYVLSFCAFYFLRSEAGVDKEAIDGKVDFGSHHLELLQAFALMRPRGGTPRPLEREAEELQKSLRGLTDSLNLAQFDFPADLPEEDLKKHFVLSEMRSQTFAIRNWAYPEQTLRHLKSMLTGALSKVIASEYGGVLIERMIDALNVLVEEANERLNSHIKRLAPVALARDFETAYRAYRQGFPDVIDDPEGMREVFERLCRRDLKRFQTVLLMHADLRLEEIFTFSLDDIVRAYGDDACRNGLAELMRTWSYQFGDLAGRDPKHFIYTNPILQRPFIRLDDDSFFWVQCGLYSHTLPGMIEILISESHRDQYMATRSRYLEETVEALCHKAFPDGSVFRGSLYRLQNTDLEAYENDILVLIDSTAIIIECKAHLIDPPAKRGAEYRLVDTLQDVVVSASEQAHRFLTFLKANPGRHAFPTKSGRCNEVDTSRLLRFIPLSITYENLGFVSANLKGCVAAGLIEPGKPLVPSICITDLEIIFEILDSQAERIHYLARRAEIERTMRYHGDELDLFAFYLDTGFNIGEWEGGQHFISVLMKSKELDPYFVARADGISVPKPRLKLTDWWRAVLSRIEQVKTEFWTEIAYIFLSVTHRDQQKFERGFKKLVSQIQRGKVPHKHNCVTLINGTRAVRQYAVLGFPYKAPSRDERNQMISHFMAQAEASTLVLGIAVLGVDMESPHYPYDVLAYAPGHATGAVDFTHLISRK